MMNDKETLFLEALHENSITKMMQVPKSDLHNHVGRGGNIKYLSKLMGYDIIPLQNHLIFLMICKNGLRII